MVSSSVVLTVTGRSVPVRQNQVDEGVGAAGRDRLPAAASDGVSAGVPVGEGVQSAVDLEDLSGGGDEAEFGHAVR